MTSSRRAPARKAPAKKTKKAPAKKRTTKAERARARRREIDAELPGLLAVLERDERVRRPNLTDELAELTPPRWKSPPPSAAERAAGVYFDTEEVVRFLRFAKKLRHIKGRTYAGRPFVPDLWQVVYVLAPLFGWRRADGTRRARTVYLEVPRKNGKSTLAAAIALYLLAADGEPGAEVISGAKDRTQALAVFDVAAKMAKAAPALRRRLGIFEGKGVIVYERSSSSYKVISSDRKGDRKHGLNLHGGVIDELHVIDDRDLIETIETATGSREQPVIVFITTAGIPEESPVWADKHAHGVNVAERTVEDPELLVCIYAADEAVALNGQWARLDVIRATNPGFGRSLRPDYIATKIARAKTTPAALNSFLRLHLNIPRESVSGWLELASWDRTASIVDAADLAGARAFGGLDLASSLDFTAFALVFPDEANETLDVLMRFWTPADTLEARSHRDRADYVRWARDGFITTTPGEVIDDDVVEADIAEVLDLYDVVGIDYDPWSSRQIVRHLGAEGAPLFALRQGFLSMSPPTKETEALVVGEKLRHGGNPVLRWMVANTRVASDPAGNRKPDRKRSRSRIDGVVALIMAIDAHSRDLAVGRSVYEERGVVVG